MDVIESPTPLLDGIDSRTSMVKIADRLRERVNYTKTLPPGFNGSEPLIKKTFPPQEVREALEKFILLGAQTQRWDEWYNAVLTQNCIYIPNDNKSKSCCISDESRVWLGRDQIRKNLGSQLSLLPQIRYSRIDHYLIKDNQCIIYVNNDMYPRNTVMPYTIPNITIIYYAGGGRFNFIEDFYNKEQFTKVVFQYLWTDFWMGGDAWKMFIKNLIF